MNTNISIRRAIEKDIPFLIETILAAEKSGTETLAYCPIFSLSENEFTGLLKNILEEDIQGQELCVSDFIIAEVNGVYAGACCGWIEGEHGASSSLKASILHYFLGEEKIAKAQNKIKLADALHIEREPGILQLESIYIRQDFRGKGVLQKLFEEHISEAKRKTDLDKAQIQLMKTNESALKAYHKLGFEIIMEKHSDNPEILRILPSHHKVMMQKFI